MFRSVGCEFMQGHRQRLDGGGPDHDALRSVERHISILFGRLRRQFGREKLIKGDAIAGRGPGQQPLNARKGHQAIPEAGLECIERPTRKRGRVPTAITQPTRLRARW